MNDCLNFLKRHNIRPEQAYFSPAHPVQMLLRTMRNLNNSYTREGDALRAERVQVLITHLELTYGGQSGCGELIVYLKYVTVAELA